MEDSGAGGGWAASPLRLTASPQARSTQPQPGFSCSSAAQIAGKRVG